MKITKLFTALAFSFSLLQAVGFDSNTTITTSSGRLKPMKELKVGDEVVCYNKNFLPESSAIKGIFEITEDSSIEITTEENVILNASKTERFFLPKEGAWVCAKELKEGDCLLNEDLEAVKITKVVQQDGERKFLVITVDTHHNFLASEGKYLVHNGPYAAYCAYWATKSICWGGVGVTSAAGTAVLVTTTIGTGGTAPAVIGALINTGSGLAVSTIGAAGTSGAALAGAAIAAVPIASEVAAASTVMAATSSIGLAASIEAVSVAAMSFAMALPGL